MFLGYWTAATAQRAAGRPTTDILRLAERGG
jgi:hypothetical protein